MNYSKAIRIIRSARGLSQKELSESVKLNPGYISRLEKGTRQPTREALERISKALHVPLYLIILLATEDTNKIPKDHVSSLAEDLLHMLLESESSNASSNPKTA